MASTRRTRHPASSALARRPIADDLPAVCELLASAGLPTSDVAEKRDRIWTFEDDGEFVGVGGFERYNEAALLRSVAVVPERRGEGYGTAIVSELVDAAFDAGVDSVYLLTTSAAPFFAELGFAEVDRSSVPPLVGATAEFADLCPDSATCMRLDR